MIQKTVRTFMQRRPSWKGRKLHELENEKHTEKYHRSTWWLLGLIPLYTHDTIIGNSL